MTDTKQSTEGNDVIKQFMELLNQQNMGEQSQDFMELFRFAAGMQLQLAVMADELQGVRQQLEQLQENQPKSFKENLMDKAERLQEKITDLSERLSAVKDHLVETAAQAVNAFKEKGKSEMCNIVQKGISGVKSALEDFRERLAETILDCQKTANQIDSIGNELKQIGNSVSNKLAALDGNEWDGNIQDFMEENGAEYIPIIVKDGRNSGMPEFFDITVDLKAEEVSLEKELSGMEYAASIIHRLEHGKGVFSPDERNLIVNYGYKLDDYEKTKELADMLAYRIENEPANAALTVIDAQAEIDALPDGMIGLSEMHGYGYTWEEMLPLTKETSLELFDHDLPVYQLHKNGSETLKAD